MEVVALLDMSGSMKKIANDTIEGFNEFLDILKQKGKTNKIDITLSLIGFNQESKLIWTHQDVRKRDPLTAAENVPNGKTAMSDAIGNAIVHLEKLKIKPDNVVFFISTDGIENGSTKWTTENVRNKIVFHQN